MEVGDLDVLAWRLFEESNDAVLLLDPNTEEIRLANPAAQKLTGLPWRRLRDRRLNELVKSEPAGRITKLLSAVQETGFFHSQEEYLLHREQQDPLPINVSASRLHATSGNVGLIVLRDISERKRAEKALRRLSGRLQKQVFQQTNELRAVNSSLLDEIEYRKNAQRALRESYQQLREAIGQLERAKEQAIHRERLHAFEQIAGGIAHDVNNSLASVLAFTELILAEDLDNQMRQWVEGIRTASTDIAATVTRLRQFCGQPSDHESKEEIDLAELVSQVIPLTRPKWRDESLRNGKEITVSASVDSTPRIIANTSALRSVLTNLIFNAADAIEHTGRIEVRIAEQETVATVEVIDNGAGMSDDTRRCCLEPFYTTKSEGTGLGLSVCHGIITGLGGKMEIESERGRGTAVRLRIPKPRTAPLSNSSDPLRTSPNVPATVLDGKRILYVDDDRLARESTAALLRSRRMGVDTAEDGPTGLAMFQDNLYDAVITDMSMPGMDGLQLTAEVKGIEPTKPVIVITGWLEIDSRNELESAQPDRVLTKPLGCDELTSALIRLFQTGSC